MAANKKTANNVLQDNGTAMKQAVREKAGMMLIHIQPRLKEIKKVARINICAAGITLIAVIIALLVIM